MTSKKVTTPMDARWPEHCEQRAFVDGARWMFYERTGATAFPSEVDEMECEAVRRYGEPKLPPPTRMVPMLPMDEAADRRIEELRASQPPLASEPAKLGWTEAVEFVENEAHEWGLSGYVAEEAALKQLAETMREIATPAVPSPKEKGRD